MADPSAVPTLKGKVKETVWKGVVSVASLATAAAVPLLVQRFLPPPPPTTPASTIPVASPQLQPQVAPDAVVSPDEGHQDGDRKRRNRNKPDK
jgi:hypothetical protein